MNILLSAQDKTSSGVGNFLASSAQAGQKPESERFAAAFKQEMDSENASEGTDSKASKTAAQEYSHGQGKNLADENDTDASGNTLPDEQQTIAALDKSIPGTELSSPATKAQAEQVAESLQTASDKMAELDTPRNMQQTLTVTESGAKQTALDAAASQAQLSETGDTTQLEANASSAAAPKQQNLIASADLLNPLPEEQNESIAMPKTAALPVVEMTRSGTDASSATTALKQSSQGEQTVAASELKTNPVMVDQLDGADKSANAGSAAAASDAITDSVKKSVNVNTSGIVMNKQQVSEDAMTENSGKMSKLFSELQQNRIQNLDRAGDGAINMQALQPQKVLSPEPAANQNYSMASPLLSSVEGNSPLSANPLHSTSLSNAKAGEFSLHAETQAGTDAWNKDISAKISWLSNQKINKAEISLHPAELGALDITINTEDDRVTVSIVTRNDAAREMLEGSLPKLAELLKNNGLALAESNISQQQAEDQHNKAQAGDDKNTAGVGQDQDIDEADNRVNTASIMHKGSIDHYV